MLNHTRKCFKSINFSDIVLIVIVAIALGSFYPAMWDIFLIGHVGNVFKLIYLFIWFLFVLLFKKKTKIEMINTDYILLFSILIIYYFIHCVVHKDQYTSLITFIEIPIVVFLAYNTFEDSKKFMGIFTFIHCVMILFMAIGSILLYLNILKPIGDAVIIEGDGAKVINYGLFYWKTHLDWDDLIIRPSGYYDEPGSLAFITFLLLAYNRLHLKNRYVEVILLFGCLFTLSAAHFITFLLYIMLFLLKRDGEKRYYIVILFIIGLVYFFFLSSDNDIIRGIHDALFERAGRIADGTDASRNFDASKKAFIQYFPYGSSIDEIDQNFPGATHETMWYSLARYGLIGSIIFFLPVILLLIKKTKRGLLCDDMKLLYIFLVLLFQRPNFYCPIYCLIMYFIWFNKERTACQKS